MAISNNSKIRWYWWFYIAAIFALGYGRMLERLIKSSGGFWSQFGPPIGVTILTIGMVYCLRNRAYLSVRFWRAVHGCLVFVLLLAFVFAVYLAATGVYPAAGMMLLLTVVLVPAHVALFQYSYRSSELWSST